MIIEFCFDEFTIGDFLQFNEWQLLVASGKSMEATKLILGLICKCTNTQIENLPVSQLNPLIIRFTEQLCESILNDAL